MTSNLHLRVVTPDRTLVDHDVRAVEFMGVDGSYGILARHAPLMTATVPGAVTITHVDGRREDLVVTEGFGEAGEKAADIDLERARAAEKRARDLLANRAALAAEDVIKAEEALRRALIRQVIGQRKGQSVDR
jgi:F-type H+-transporting ATPase subunit epsilon